jgi:hypothetical protein
VNIFVLVSEELASSPKISELKELQTPSDVKIREIVEAYWSDDSSLSLPDNTDLEVRYEDIMSDLCAQLESAAKPLITKISSKVCLMNRRLRKGVKPANVKIPAGPIGLCDFLMGKSTAYEVFLIDPVINILADEKSNLQQKFSDYKSDLAKYLEETLTSCRKKKVQLKFHHDYTHMACRVSKEQVFLSLMIHLKDYFSKEFNLDYMLFEGFIPGSATFFFSMLREHAILLAPKILLEENLKELKDHFGLTDIVVFDYFHCNLEEATVKPMPSRDFQLKTAELQVSCRYEKQHFRELKEAQAKCKRLEETTDHLEESASRYKQEASQHKNELQELTKEMDQMTDNLKWLILCAKEKNVFGRILGLEEDSRDMERLQSIYKTMHKRNWERNPRCVYVIDLPRKAHSSQIAVGGDLIAIASEYDGRLHIDLLTKKGHVVNRLDCFEGEGSRNLLWIAFMHVKEKDTDSRRLDLLISETAQNRLLRYDAMSVDETLERIDYDWFSSPSGIAVRDNSVYVCDNDFCHKLECQDEGIRTVTQVSFRRDYQRPCEISLTEQSMYIVEGGAKKIHIFGENGKFIKDIETSYKPTCIATTSCGHLIVTSWFESKIYVYRSDGSFVRSFGELGSKEGQFRHPCGVAVDESGLIYVVDSGNNRIQVF